MSRIALLCILAISLLSTSAQAQYTWTTVPTGTNEVLTNVKIYNPREVVVVGFNGTVLVSQDYGHTFIARNASNQNLYGIVFIDQSTFLVGGNDIIMKTEDAGATWASSDQPGFAVRGMTMDSTGVLYASGSYSGVGRMMLSRDSGTTWQVVSSGIATAQLYPSITTNTAVITSGVDGHILYTLDHGKSFLPSSSSASNWIRAGAGAGDAAYMVGEGGTFGRSTNGGSAWAFSNLLGSTSLQGVAAHDSVVFVVTDDSRIALSIDQGRNWLAVYSSVNFPNNLSKPLHGVDFFGPNRAAFVVGNDGLIMRRGPDTITVIPGPSDTSEWRIATKSGISAWRTPVAISLAPTGVGIAVGGEGTVQRSINAGRSWQCDSVGHQDYVACSYVTPAEWYIFSYQSREMLHSIDSGLTWFLEVAPTTGQIYRATSSSHTLVAVGQQTIGHGVICVKHENGQWKTLTQASSGGTLPELALVASLGNNLWIAKGMSSTSYILSSDDGESWSIVADADTNVNKIISLSSLNGAPMGGSDLGIVGYLNANNAWIFGKAFIPTNRVVGVAGGQSVGFAADVSGRIWRTTESPYDWRQMTTPQSFQLNDIQAIDSGHAVAYGYSSQIWYYSKGPITAAVRPTHTASTALQLTVTPNPASYHAAIEIDRTQFPGVTSLTIQDMLGRTVLREMVASDRYVLDASLASLSSGHYLITIEESGKRASAMLVLSR